MNLKQLLNLHGQIQWGQISDQQNVTGLFFDSRLVIPGSIYVALRGHQSDGHDYLKQACDLGAVALVVEDTKNIPQDFTGAQVLVLDSRIALQVLSQRFFKEPGEQMLGIAITGTNGKTSTAYIFEHLLKSLSLKCGVIGTIDHHVGDKRWKTNLTTPDPVTLQKRLSEFVDLGCEAFVIEASSHALDQNRIRQGFDLCLFTNLSRDHLDYHKTFEHYLNSKAKLFSSIMLKEERDNLAMINGDDPKAQELITKVEGREIFTFGCNEKNDFQFKILNESIDGTEIQLQYSSNQKMTFKSPLIGLHNAYNVVGALAGIFVLGLDLRKAAQELIHFSGVPGRLNKIKSKSGLYAFIDYAHTPEALEQVLKTLLPYKKADQKLITVFGCGGDRDPGKRPMMGDVATKLSDFVIITSDNPRSENPQLIIDAIALGIAKEKTNYETVVDRKQAIEKAVSMMKPGDLLLVAGKGHEDYQIIGDQTLSFDDAKVVQQTFLRS